jgi:hypothetical protein
VTDISGGEARPRIETSVAADKLLEQTFKALEGAHFVGKGDRQKVQQMLAEFEWLMKTAMEQATQDYAGGDLTIDPSLSLRKQSERSDSAKSLLKQSERSDSAKSLLKQSERSDQPDPDAAEAPPSQHEADEVELTEIMSTASGERTPLSGGKRRSFIDYI